MQRQLQRRLDARIHRERFLVELAAGRAPFEMLTHLGCEIPRVAADRETQVLAVVRGGHGASCSFISSEDESP